VGKLDARKKIGVIGFGNMGSVIALRLAAVSKEYEVFVFEKDRHKTLKSKAVVFLDSLSELAHKCEVLILAVKPQDADHLLRDLKNSVRDKLIISIAAGLGTKHIEKILGQVRVVRAMPNIAAKVAESVTCLCKGSYALDDDMVLANELFYYLGTVRDIEEGLMDAATAISGSGPGYICYFIENSLSVPGNVPEHARHDMMRRLEKAAQALGFNDEDASFLAANTVNASISLLRQTGIPAAELRAQVTSKAGTTEAGIEVLRNGGSWEEAAQAALKRAKDLAKSFS
jgi:pyrroline-5-carboxylate reductase